MCLFAASGLFLLPELSKGAKSWTFVKSQNTRKPFKRCSGGHESISSMTFFLESFTKSCTRFDMQARSFYDGC